MSFVSSGNKRKRRPIETKMRVANKHSKASVSSNEKAGDGLMKKKYKSAKFEAQDTDFPIEDVVEIYTDGSCFGNYQVQVRTHPAGWGIRAKIHKGSKSIVIAEGKGPVDTQLESQFFIGAQVTSNNTGELSAIGMAFQFLLGLNNYDESLLSKTKITRKQAKALEKKLDGRKIVRILSDSQYAMKSVLEIYNGSQNKLLIESIRAMKVEMEKIGYIVSFRHVRGHRGDPDNEAVDALAKQGNNCKTPEFYLR